MKIIGTRKDRSPAECLRAQERLIRELNRTRPFPKIHGRVLRFSTWQALDEFNRMRAAERT